MQEKIFNLFIFIENDIIYELGVVVHEKQGTDKEKTAFLKSRVTDDYQKAIRFPIPKRYTLKDLSINQTIAAITYENFRMLTHMNLALHVFEDIFESFHAPQSPLVCVTPIIEGQIKFDATEEIKLPNEQDLQKMQEVEKITIRFSDYKAHYMTDEGFDLSNLLNDDYVLAIKLLYNNGHYVSSLKLLMSFIDTVAYLEFGDTNKNFQKWLDQYTDLSSINISSDEVWEMRNSILHMTNSDSRKVLEGKVRRIMFYVGTLSKGLPDTTDQAKYFELISLMKSVYYGVDEWLQSYNIDRSKFQTFIQRYDCILSDSRYQMVEIE